MLGKFTLIRYDKYFPKLLYQGVPSVSEFPKHELSLVFLYRIPPKRYLRKLRRLNVRVIFCIHGITTVVPLLSVRLFFFKMYTKFALHYFSKFFSDGSRIMAQVLSRNTGELLYSMGADKEHVFRITNGVEFYNFAVGRNHDRFVVVFMGRMVNIQKGIDRLKRILGKLPEEINVSVIGSGPDSWMLNSARRENVQVLGFIPEDEKREKLREANLLILTSNLDPFPLVILEGLASGLPCVATPVEGALEILGQDKIFGTISSFDPDDFARDVVRYFDEWKTDKELYFQNKMRRRDAAKKHYDLSVMMEEYYRMILRILTPQNFRV